LQPTTICMSSLLRAAGHPRGDRATIVANLATTIAIPITPESSPLIGRG